MKMRPIDGKDLADTILGEIFDRGQDSARYEEMREVGYMSYRDTEYLNGVSDGMEYVYRMIDNAPTIEAIPISFLEKLRDNAQNEEAALMIDEIIAQWRKEKDGTEL